MTPDPGPPEALPGLEVPTPPASELVANVSATLGILEDRGLVTAVHAGKRALALELAQVIAHKRATGRASTIGNDARVLMEILDSFVPEASDTDAELAAAMAEWSEVMNRGTSTDATP